MKTCLVTGASGFLGREVVPGLGGLWQVVGVAHRPGSHGFRSCDLRDARAVERMLSEVSPDAVVHTAAYREPDYCEDHPEETRRLNVDAVETLCRLLPEPVRFLYIGTDYTFDGRNPPYAEDDPPNPVNVYGRSKVEGEKPVLAREGGQVLRVPVLVGGGSTLAESGFIGQMVDAIRGGVPQEVDDVLMRFPTWTRDVASAIAFLLGREESGCFHLSGSRGGTRYAWTCETAKMLGLCADPLTPSHQVVPRRAVRPPDSQLSDARIHGLGFRPCTDFREVVESVLAGVEDL